MIWSERKTIDIKLEDLPFSKDKTILISSPSKLRVNIPDIIFPVDIGAWCYTKRRKKHRPDIKKDCFIWEVDINSYEPKREKIVLQYAEYIFILHKLGKSNQTIVTIHNIFQIYMHWCDNNYPKAFNTNKDTIMSLIKYADDLNHRVQNNSISINTASCYQQTVVKFIEFTNPDRNPSILSEVNPIKRRNISINKTQPPATNDAAVAYELYETIFGEICNIIKSNKSFPLKLATPNEIVWVFPINRLLATKKVLSERKLWDRYCAAYDYENGKIFNLDETIKGLNGIKQYKKSHAKKLIINAQNNIADANTNKYHHKRIALAILSMQSFVMMFSANTGMNLSSIASLIWHDIEHEITIDQQGFKTIKARSENKEVEFRIGNKFYIKFKQYLELRKYLLSAYPNATTSLLFFKIIKYNFEKIGMSTSYEYNKRIERLFGIKISISTRSWRAHKSDWLIRNTDIPTTALILQNSTNTVLKSYIEGTEAQAGEEMSEFYKSFHKKVIITTDTHTVQTSVGQCKKIGQSETNAKNEVIQPNCKTPEGCLFCNQYAIIADNEDIRKIISLKYIINETRVLASSDNHHKSIFGEVSNRINFILKSLKNKSNKIKSQVKKIEHEVSTNELLSPYWERKLRLLVDLEVIS